MKKILQKAALLISGLSFASLAKAATIMVTVTNFSFTPANFTANVGDTVMWMWSAGSHTTTSLTVPTGAATWSNPMNSTNTMFMYIITKAGNYTYWCAIHTSSMEGSFTVNPAGIPTVSNTPKNAITVFPNPANGVLNIHLGNTTGNDELIISDLLGRQMLKQSPASTDNTIDVSTWRKGIYFYDLRRNGESISGKFEVQ